MAYPFLSKNKYIDYQIIEPISGEEVIVRFVKKPNQKIDKNKYYTDVTIGEHLPLSQLIKIYQHLPQRVLLDNGILPPETIIDGYDQVFFAVRCMYIDVGSWLENLILGEKIPNLNPHFKPEADLVKARFDFAVATNNVSKKLASHGHSGKWLWMYIEYLNCQLTLENCGFLGEAKPISKSKREQLVRETTKYDREVGEIQKELVTDLYEVFCACAKELWIIHNDLETFEAFFKEVYGDYKTNPELKTKYLEFDTEVANYVEFALKPFLKQQRKSTKAIRNNPLVKICYVEENEFKYIDKSHRRKSNNSKKL